MMHGPPFINFQSSGLTDAARTLDQDLIVSGNGLLDFSTFENIG